MKLILFCCLFSGLIYGSESSDKKKPWKTVDSNRPWSQAPNDTRTWFEWYYGFRMKRIYEYANVIVQDHNGHTSELCIDALFANHDLFAQDPEQKHWLLFCENETKKLREASTAMLMPYKVEKFYDCCGAPLRHAMESQPQKYKKMIELVNAAEQYLIAAKALEKVKSQK